MMKTLSLKTKFLAGSLGLVMLLGLGVIVFVRTELMGTFEADLQKRGLAIARDFADDAVEPLLRGNVPALRIIARNHKRNEEDIKYLFVANSKGEVFAHTFGDAFPEDLRKANPLKQNQAYSIRPLIAGKEDVFDIAAPILKGRLGTVHVGISVGPIGKSIDGITRDIAWMLVGVLAFGSVVAVFFTGRITRPLAELTKAAGNVGSGDLTRRVAVGTQDELGQLATTFNKMLDELLRTTVSRVQLERLVKERTAEITETNAKLQALIQAMPDTVFFKDISGRYVLVNRAFEELLGANREIFIGKTDDDFMPPNLAASCKKSDETLMKNGAPLRAEDTMIGKNGEKIFLDSVKAPIYDTDGNLLGIVGVSRDVTERKRAAETIEFLSRRNELILKSAGEGICGVDLDGVMIFANPAAAEMTGWTVEELIGRSQHEVLHHSLWDGSPHRPEDCRIYASMGDGAVHRVADEAFWRKDGTNFPVEYVSTPIKEDGKVVGAVIVFSDISERKLSEQSLRLSEERFSRAQKMAHVGNWEKNLVTGQLYWSEEIYRIYGVDPSQFIPTTETFIKAIHSEDREPFIKALNEARIERKKLDVDFRLVRPDGTVRTIHTLGEVTYDPIGRPLIHSGTIQDITERRQAEETLFKTNKTLDALIRYSPLAIICLDADSNVMIWNPAAELIFGWREDEVLGRKNPIVPEDKETEYRWLTDGVRQGEPYLGKELCRKKKDGALIYLSASSAAIRGADGKTVAFFAIFQDITSRHTMEEALRKSEENYRSLLEQASDGIAVIDRQGRYLDVNSRMCEMMGYSREDFLKLAITDLVAPGEMSTTAPSRLSEILAGKTILSERLMRRKDGTIFPMEISATRIPDGRLCGIHRDISERKQVEEMLKAAMLNAKEEKARAEAVISAIGDSLVIINPDFRILYQNQVDKEIIGDHHGELCYRAYEGRSVQCEDCPAAPAFRDGKIHRGERSAATKAGLMHLDITASPLLDASGKVIAVIEMVKDVTERKQAERQIFESEQKYKNLVELTSDIIYLSDNAGNQTYMNDAAYKVLGYSPEEVIGRPWINLIHPNDREITSKVFSGMMERKTDMFSFENRYVTKTGRTINVLHNIRVLRDAQGGVLGVQGIARDITGRKNAEENLKLFSKAIDEATDGVQIVDLDGYIVYSNRASESMYGYGPGEMTSKHVDELSAEGDYSRRVIIPSMKETGHWNGEVLNVRKDGTVFPVWLSSSLVKNDRGGPFAMVGIIRDITERKRVEEALMKSHEELEVLVRERTAELRMLNDQLRDLSVYLQEAREQERTTIAREIHDELGQSLTALKMDLSILNKRLPGDRKAILEKTESMAELIEATIQSVKRISTELRPGILDHLGLTAAIEWQAGEFEKRTGVLCDVAFEPEELVLDRPRSTAIFRIFQEALTNITRHAEAANVAIRLKRRNGKLVLQVRDDGKGITQKELSDPKSLGLIGIRERVHYWKGSLAIRGSRNKGTALTVRIPLDDTGEAL